MTDTKHPLLPFRHETQRKLSHAIAKHLDLYMVGIFQKKSLKRDRMFG